MHRLGAHSTRSLHRQATEEVFSNLDFFDTVDKGMGYTPDPATAALSSAMSYSSLRRTYEPRPPSTTSAFPPGYATPSPEPMLASHHHVSSSSSGGINNTAVVPRVRVRRRWAVAVRRAVQQPLSPRTDVQPSDQTGADDDDTAHEEADSIDAENRRRFWDRVDLCLMPQHLRTVLIRQRHVRKCEMVAMHLAAMEIQRVWRGHCARRPTTQGGSRRRRNSSRRKSVLESTAPRMMLLAKFIEEVAVHRARTHNAHAALDWRDWCARRIQCWWRVHIVLLREARQHPPMYVLIAVLKVQRHWRRHHRRLVECRGHVHRLAARIQRAWRRSKLRDVFAYYRNLIQFHDRGDPNVVLRSINPRESKLLDNACGAHVRLRLGGSSFPPEIYYKVFVHSAIVDMGAFSPQDYVHARRSGGVAATSAAIKTATPRDVLDETIDLPDGWYRRFENNDWRPVSLTVRTRMEQLHWAYQQSKMEEQGHKFHYKRLVRREDKLRAKKRRRREWLMKMYQQGLVKPRDDMQDHVLAQPTPSTPDALAPRHGATPDPLQPGHGASLDLLARGSKRNASRFSAATSVDSLAAYTGEDEDGFAPSRCVTATPAAADAIAELITDAGMDEDEWEERAHELLQWSEALDFNAYQESWQSLATTDRFASCSDAYMYCVQVPDKAGGEPYVELQTVPE